MALSNKEKEELLSLAQSPSFTEEMKQAGARKYKAFIVDGKVDADRWIAFLNAYNEFIDHRPKPFGPMMEEIMKL